MLRVVAAVAVAAVGSFLPDISGRRAAFFLLCALIWVPLASVVLFASDRPGSAVAGVGGPVVDLLVLFAVQTLVPNAKEAVLIGYLVVVAFGVYTLGRSFAVLLGTAATALTLLSQALVDRADRLTTPVLLPFSIAVLALVVLFERTAVLQARATTRYERLQSKADTILDHVADGVVVTAGDGTVEQCNPAALQITRLRSDDVVGRACHEVLGLHVGERVLHCALGCPLVGLTVGAEGALGVEVWRHDGTGRRQPLLANATAVASDDGEVEVVHSLRDITRLKQAEEAKTLFLATASHELKTPLTVINGFAATLSAYPDIDGDTRDAALNAITVRAQELSRIVDRLLLSSRIEAGQIKLTVEEVDVVTVLQERVTTCGLATGRAISMRVDGTVVPVAGNREALVTVVDHLLDNALKYSPDGGPVTVTVTSGDGAVSIEINDCGIGMDYEQTVHCFDKFWQAESTDVRRFGGTGIGLYIVQSLIDAMDGHVFVMSEPGEGSTFVVQLRAADVDAADDARRVGESTSIREFMRQLGVPERRKV